MFWGLILEPKRRYSQVVKQPFHISMAALDIFSANEEPTQLMLHHENRNYLLCTLQKGNMLQCSLDLNFQIGDEVVFTTNGQSNIHLSGYLHEVEDDLEEEEDVEEEEEAVEPLSKKLKRKFEKAGSQVPTKKSKLAVLLDKELENYDSDEDESFDVGKSMNDSSDISSASHVEEEDDDSDEEESGDDEDDDVEEEENDEESSLSDEEEEEPKPHVNGIASKKSKSKEETPKKPKQSEQNVKSPKVPNKTPKIERGEKGGKTPIKQEKKTPKPDSVQKGNKTPKVEKTPKSNKTPKDEKAVATPNKQANSPQKRHLEGGVIVEDLRVGDGPVAKPGKMVQVYYEGRLKQNNKVFDHNSKGSGFKFRLGKQEVIKGWDVGVAGMKIGGKRRIICPPQMAYGQKGSPPVIPPNSTLIFEVEMKNIS